MTAAPPFPLRDRIGSALTVACPKHHCSKQGPAVWAVVSPALEDQAAEIARLTGALEAAEDLTSRLREDHRAEIAEAEKQIRTADARIAMAQTLAADATRTGCGAGWDLNPDDVLAALDPPKEGDGR